MKKLTNVLALEMVLGMAEVQANTELVAKLETMKAQFEKKNSKAGIYFNLTLESIPLIAKLNTKEILFSTIYFGKEKITIWGNYNKHFPVFYTDDKIYNKYKLIAEKNKLIIE